MDSYDYMYEDTMWRINKSFLFHASGEGCKLTFKSYEYDFFTASGSGHSTVDDCSVGQHHVTLEYPTADGCIDCDKVAFKIFYKIHDELSEQKINKYMHMQYLYPLNKPSANDDELIIYNKMSYNGDNFIWKIPREQEYLLLEENGYVTFTNYFLPCTKEANVSVWIKEKDFFTGHELSHEQQIECSPANTLLKQKFQLGDYEGRGGYQLIGA